MSSSNSGREPSLGGGKKKSTRADARLAGDRAVLHMVEKLDDPDPIVRERAALALGELGDERSFEVLLEIVRNPDFNVALRALHALRNYQSPKYFEPLLSTFWELSLALDLSKTIIACDRERAFTAFSETLAGQNISRRRLAVRALSHFDDRDLVPLYVGMLEDADQEVRKQAVHALSEQRDPRSIPALIARLGDTDYGIVESTALELGRIGDRRAVPALLALALGGYPRMHAAWALGMIKDPDATAALVRIALDQSEDLPRRIAAVESLGNMRDRSAVIPLLSIYDDPSEDQMIRDRILPLIGEIGGEVAEERLAKELENPDEDIRLYAFNGLTWIHSERSARLILALVDDPGPTLQMELAEFFDMFGEGFYPDEVWPVRPFAEALNSDNPWLRQFGAQALGHIKSAEATAALIGAVHDPNREVQTEVVKGLGRQESVEMVDILIGMLENSEQQTRIAVMRALWSIGDRRAIEPLIEAADDPDPVIRYHAINTLGMMRAVDAVPLMIRHLADREELPRNRRVCDVAAAYLEAIRTPEAIAAVEAWRRSQP